MSNLVEKELLKEGTFELYNRGKITIEVKNDLDSYIDSSSNIGVIKLNYNDFNKSASKFCDFNDFVREIAYNGVTEVAEAISNKIVKKVDMKILAIKCNGILQDSFAYTLSYNGTTWFHVDDRVTNEEITGDFYIKLSFNGENRFWDVSLIYEQL